VAKGNKKDRSSNTRIRTIDSLKRPDPRRQPRKSMLIVCEGQETEPRYFTSLKAMYKLKLVEIEIIGKGETPITVVNRALTMQEEREKDAEKDGFFTGSKFDEVWCVFDREGNHQSPSFHQAVNKALANKLELAISNPSFEFWFIIHFEQTTKPFQNASDVIPHLKKHIPNYQKNLEVCNKIFHLTEDAIKHSEWILNSHKENSAESYPNPSTEVHMLVKKLKAMTKYGVS